VRANGDEAEAPLAGLLMVTPPADGVGACVGSGVGAGVLAAPEVTTEAELPHAEIANAASRSATKENCFR
jgi:hypothetical protein